MRTLRSLAMSAAAAAAALFCGAALAAGPDELKPPLKGLHERKDPTGSIAFDLPVNWTDRGPDPKVADCIMHWHGFIGPPNDSGPDLNIWCAPLHGYSRAKLVFWMLHAGRPGEEDPASIRSGPDWIEEYRPDAAKGSGRLFRVIERDGRLYEVVASCNALNYKFMKDHIDYLLGTFRVMKHVPRPAAPSSVAASTLDTRTLWTDVKDKKVIKKIADRHAAIWKQCTALFPGTPAWSDPPLLILCDTQEAWADTMEDLGPASGPTIELRNRGIGIRASQANDTKRLETFELLSAIQYVRHAHGGPSPIWIEFGLAVYLTHGEAAKGKPEKLTAAELSFLKMSAGTQNSTMDQLWSLPLTTVSGDIDDAKAVYGDCWSWHLFFRHGGDSAKPYAERYNRTLAILRESGDIAAARDVWKDVDQNELRKAHRVWIADRK